MAQRRPKKTAPPSPQDSLLRDLNDTMAGACRDAYRDVLRHWAPRLAKHGLPGSAAAARRLGKLTDATPVSTDNAREWWLGQARELGDDLGRELAIAHVRDAIVGLLADQERAGRARRPTGKRPARR